jgi:hypothetical protein
MLLTGYLWLYEQYDSTWYVLDNGYYPSEQIGIMDTNVITITNASQLAAYVFQGKIIPELDAFGQPIKATFLSTFKFV